MPKYLIIMSDKEIEEWKQMATADGRTLASWIRYCLNRVKVVKK